MKNKTVKKILAAALAGQSIFGENYAQEGCAKVDWFKENHQIQHRKKRRRLRRRRTHRKRQQKKTLMSAEKSIKSE